MLVGDVVKQELSTPDNSVKQATEVHRKAVCWGRLKHGTTLSNTKSNCHRLRPLGQKVPL